MDPVYTSMLAELEDAVKNGSSEKRVSTLREVTDLFLTDAARFSDDQIAVFDDVLCLLIQRIETRARAELSTRLAPIDKAPHDIIRRLSDDDEISVAGPVIAQSPQLSPDDLIRIAQNKSQAHLMAMTGRKELSEAVTDAMLQRADRHVTCELARNTGARFSENGFAALSERAAGDDELGAAVGLRLDLPINFLRALLERATQAVRAKLLAMAGPALQDEIRAMLATIAAKVGREVSAIRNYSAAEKIVMRLHEQGQLNDGCIEEFAKKQKIEEVGAALALLSGTPLAMMVKLLSSPRTDTLLIPCKGANLRWPTVAAILRNRQPGHTVPDGIVTLAQADYIKLSKEVAERTIRFWKVRDKAAQMS
jgi:uncharacterized protein (DUF2336 family)